MNRVRPLKRIALTENYRSRDPFSMPTRVPSPLARSTGMLAFAKRTRRTIWSMTRIRGEFLDLDPSDPSVSSDVVLRRQPDEKEDEDEEDDGKGKKEDDGDNDETDDGYSE
jgi:hypothetical protein